MIVLTSFTGCIMSTERYIEILIPGYLGVEPHWEIESLQV